MNAWLDILPSAPKGVTHWQRVRLHAGTADLVARISLLKMDSGKKKPAIMPGGGGPVQILTESKIIAAAGQRFVIRFYSPLVTIGGGQIMLPNAEPAKGKPEREAKAKIIEELSAGFGPAALLAAIVRDKGILAVPGLFALSQMTKSVFDENLRLMSAAPDTYGLLEFGAARNFISGGAFAAVERAVLRILRDFHAKFPERAGIDAENLYAALNDIHGAGKITLGDFKDLLGLMAAGKSIAPVEVNNKTCYRAAGHSRSLDKKFMELVDRIKKESAAAGFNLLKLSELEEKLNAGGAISPAYMKRAMKYLQENEDFRTLEGGLLFPLETRERLLQALALMNKNGDITVAALRDQIGVNRKYSLAMLDFLDSQGFTQRVGDKRILTG
jgi:selenocysteine-specific elongation factor